MAVTDENAIECSVVVPVFNSRDCLEELARRVKDVFAGMGVGYELVLVNDGSRDGSWEKINGLARIDKNIVGVCFRKNFGQDNALMAGLRISKGKFIVIMDDDLQHDPVYIPPLLAEISRGYDVVYGNYQIKKQKVWKNLGSAINDRMANIVLGKPPHVYLSPFKIISRGAVEEVCKYEGAYPYLDGLLFRVTSGFSQIPVEHKDRFKGTSNYTLWRSLRVWMHLATNFSVFPLRIATFLGLFCSAFALILGMIFLVYRLLHPGMEGGWASLILSVLGFGGIQLFSIGILGEYMGRTFLNINRQPQYTIKETLRGNGPP